MKDYANVTGYLNLDVKFVYILNDAYLAFGIANSSREVTMVINHITISMMTPVPITAISHDPTAHHMITT